MLSLKRGKHLRGQKFSKSVEPAYCGLCGEECTTEDEECPLCGCGFEEGYWETKKPNKKKMRKGL